MRNLVKKGGYGVLGVTFKTCKENYKKRTGIPPSEMRIILKSIENNKKCFKIVSPGKILNTYGKAKASRKTKSKLVRLKKSQNQTPGLKIFLTKYLY